MITESLYLGTAKMARLLGYSKDYLLRNRGVLFFEGIHYFPKERRTDWKVTAMIDWVENNRLSPQAQEVLDRVS
jgi:hypothetical protein